MSPLAGADPQLTARAAGAPAAPLGHPCHVLQLIETGGPGGAEQVLVSLTAALASEPGFRASAGLLKPGYVADELARRALPATQFRIGRALDPGLVVALTRHLRRTQVDLVHAHEFTMNVYGATAAWLARVPAIATVHGRGYYAQARRRLLALRFAARTGATVVAVSGDIQHFLGSEVGIPGVQLVPNGIDLTRPASGDRERGRRAIGVGPAATLIGNIGNLYPVKGHRVLLQAMAELGPEVELAIAGRGDEEAALRMLARELGIAERVHFLGYRDDTPDLLAACDVYALPSLFEGQSLALIEAMAARLPIVATAVGGNPEVLGPEGVTGLYAPKDDAPALAAQLRRLTADPALRSRLGDAALARARQEFSLAAMVARYRTLYAEVLAGRARRGGRP